MILPLFLLLATCACPLEATTRRAVLSADGLVACGDESLVYEIFRCDRREPILRFDGTQTARVERSAEGMRVVEIAKWPYGKGWEYLDIPMIEWRIAPNAEAAPKPRLIAPRPAVTKKEIAAFLAEYRKMIREARAADEETVARLFTAAMSGDKEAIALFATMKKDVKLDGAAGETYTYAEETFTSPRR